MTEQEKSLDEAIGALSEAAIELLEDVIRVDSTNPLYAGVRREDVIGGETKCARMIGRFLEQHGFALHEVAPDPERVNVVAQLKGAGGGWSLLVNGHVDTVAAFHPEQWKSGSPWRPLREEGRLYGLGATDMAGGLIAGALAAAALADTGVKLAGDLSIHAVVGEETRSNDIGTSAVIEAGFCADAAIVAEPSSSPRPLSVQPISVCSSGMTIRLTGRASHAGNRADSIRAGGRGAAAGVNAVEKMILIVTALQDLEREWAFSKRHPAFMPGQFCMLPAYFHSDVGFPHVGFMADHAEVGYLVYVSPDESVENVQAEVEAYIAHVAALDPWLREHPPTVEWRPAWPAANTPEDHPLVQMLVRRRADVLGPISGRQTGAFTAVSDATWLEAAGIPSVVFGPGDLSRAHSMDEYVVIDEIISAARIMGRAMLDWCGPKV